MQREQLATTPRLIDRLPAVLDDMRALVEARRAAGEKAERAYGADMAALLEQLDAQRAAIERQAADELAAVEEEYQRSRQELLSHFDAQHGARQREYEAIRQRISATYEAARSLAKKEYSETRWETQTVYDAKRPVPRRELKELSRQIAARLEHLAGVEQSFLAVLVELRQPLERLQPATAPDDIALTDASRQFNDPILAAEELVQRLRQLTVPGLFKGSSPVLLVTLAGLAVAGLAGWASGGDPTVTGGATVAAVLAFSGLFVWLYFGVARRQVDAICRPFAENLAQARRVAELWLSAAQLRCQQRLDEMKRQYDADMARSSETFRAKKDEVCSRRDRETNEADGRYLPLLEQFAAEHEQKLSALDGAHPDRVAGIKARRQTQLNDLETQRQARLDDLRRRRDSDWQVVAARWEQGVAEVSATVGELASRCQQVAPDWSAPAWEHWQPSNAVAEFIRYGQFQVRFDQIPGVAMPNDRLTHATVPEFTLPAVVPFPQRASLLIKTAGAGRVDAVDVLQAMMLRFLTSLPPGKVRFTIIDPVGLGQNFAGFMHLADYDEQLVGSRIWTEPQFIEQQLADITGHMSTVIQKYLRNEYESIEQYNAQAGEVAEPFRVVVVANFPFNFTDPAARHLLSIATSGARCGVYTLISVDMKQRAPQSFNVIDLEQQSTKLVWKDDRFLCRDGVWEPFPLTVDMPPAAEQVTRLLHQVGEAAKDANRVEVPFDYIAPPDGALWSRDSRSGIDIPLGRAGATRRQNLTLGSGTSQHVLIAGKTGSGKSTLLHALITNLALYYSPEEAQLYLIDFKKGVEFKTYASYELPHARVVAIESEREFGLSVLQRLDAELKIRGDRFRDLNAQDLAAFRKLSGETLPRLLLIVDEFQEFFVEDDKVSQEAALLFDRLVRQGRAFGIHVHLGSQTLGGAYSLARSTLGQMAIRIALQCSEADAHLILSEDNTAARLLTRPGEAIYNDANGRVEGNHLFQVVWLSDERREQYLKQIRELAEQRGLRPAEPQIVFEGNVPADPAKNRSLSAALSAAAWPELRVAWQAWLGDPIAIKEPTELEFRRQSGNHLLVVGQQPESALAILASTVLSLAGQLAPAPHYGSAAGRFFVLDGSPPDVPHAGYWGQLAAALPHPIDVGTVRDAGRIVDELATEVKRRQESAEHDLPELFLLVYDLQRFRDLRRADDDFGFARGGEKPSPAKQLVTVLRDGPAVGVHVLVWCDTVNNLNRAFDRPTLREFENRVLFQMNPADSSNLIDSPAAGKLGMHRGILSCEDRGLLEKFRPYSLPAVDWIASVGRVLSARSLRDVAEKTSM